MGPPVRGGRGRNRLFTRLRLRSSNDTPAGPDFVHFEDSCSTEYQQRECFLSCRVEACVLEHVRSLRVDVTIVSAERLVCGAGVCGGRAAGARRVPGGK